MAKEALPTLDKVEVRLVAPSSYRAQFLAEGHSSDSATLVVSSLAALSKVPVSQLLGGQWVQRQQGAAQHLVGYLRLKPETVAKILPYSGSNAVFINKVNDRSGGPVFWVKRLTDETREAYFRRVSKLQKERQQAIIWRQGGGQDLGFGRTANDAPATSSRIVALRGLPTMWDNDEIVSFMRGQNWKDFEVTSRKKKCSYGKGVPPPEQKDHSWRAFNVDDDPPWTISVQVLPQRPRGPMMCQAARGPARLPVSAKTPPEKNEDVEMKLPGAGGTTDQPSAAPRKQTAGTDQGSRARSRSPPVVPEKTAPIILGAQNSGVDAPPNNPDDAVNQGWKHLDFGGNGDCLFRAVGAFEELDKNVDSVSNEEAKRCGALLRMTCVQHIRNHAERFKHFFHPKLDGAGPQNFEDWLPICGQQETYANGVMLQALAEKFGCFGDLEKTRGNVGAILRCCSFW